MTRDLRAWADEHGHSNDYDKCHRCGVARQDCNCHDYEESDPSDKDDDDEAKDDGEVAP